MDELPHAEGAYKGNSAKVIYDVVSRLEIAKLKSIVHGFEENVLVTIGNVEVRGKKYSKKPYIEKYRGSFPCIFLFFNQS